MLRQFGYASLLFPSAEAFGNQSDFDGAVCVLLDIDLGDGSGIELRHRLNLATHSFRAMRLLRKNLAAHRRSNLLSKSRGISMTKLRVRGCPPVCKDSSRGVP
jgi:hypothetical protein